MPAKIKPSPTESDDLGRLLGKAVTATAASLRSRDTAPYDGVLGTLPDWIPGNIHQEFIHTRNRLLGAGYRAKQVRDFIDEDIADCRSALENHHKVISTFPYVLPPKVRKDVRTLAHIRTAQQLGPVDGLVVLTDEAHARKVAIGQRYSEQQRINASKKRGARSDVHKIIRILALEKDGEGAKALWNQLIGVLDRYPLNPKESTPPGDHRKWKVTYDYTYSSAARRPREGRKTMSFGQFESLISHYRQEKKKSG